jgi:hypothetical protein
MGVSIQKQANSKNENVGSGSGSSFRKSERISLFARPPAFLPLIDCGVCLYYVQSINSLLFLLYVGIFALRR